MAVNLKCTTGTINYNDWLRVTAAKVISPGTVVWEVWINVPISNYSFVIPNLDPENYIISYYDAPTNVDPGTLRLQLIANALTNEFIYEKRYYKCGRGLAGDPANGDDMIIDPYFTGKGVTAGFQESFRYLEPVTEWELQTTSTANDTFKLLNGHQFSTDEVFMIELKLQAGTVASTGGAFYMGRVDVADPVYDVLVADKNKRHRLVGTISTQTLNLPPLAGLSQDNMYLFDNMCGGVAKCVKLVCDGTDVVKYNGFKERGVVVDTFPEFWVDRGCLLMIAKVDDNWEVTLEWSGRNVGKFFWGLLKDHPGTIVMDGQIGFAALDGEEYPKLYWWVRNCVPSTHKIQDATVDSILYVHPDGKLGMWVEHPDPNNKKFRTGNFQNLSIRGLKDFDSYGTDPDRGTGPDGKYDYPGGKQDQKLMNHRHFNVVGTVKTGTFCGQNQSLAFQKDDEGDFKTKLITDAPEPTLARTGKPVNDAALAVGNDKNIVDNIGAVALCAI